MYLRRPRLGIRLSSSRPTRLSTLGLVTATFHALSFSNGTRTATPVSEPFYVSFVANPTSIVAGQTSTLTWTVRGVKAIYLDGEPVSGPTGSQIVKPLVTTTYVLRIIMPDNTVREEAQTVTVTAATPSVTPTTTLHSDGIAGVLGNILGKP